MFDKAELIHFQFGNKTEEVSKCIFFLFKTPWPDTYLKIPIPKSLEHNEGGFDWSPIVKWLKETEEKIFWNNSKLTKLVDIEDPLFDSEKVYDYCGGNTDDAFEMGYRQGQADMAADVRKVLRGVSP